MKRINLYIQNNSNRIYIVISIVLSTILSFLSLQPVINKQEWLHANLNSTVVNQTLSDNPGEYGFRVFFDSHEKVSSNCTFLNFLSTPTVFLISPHLPLKDKISKLSVKLVFLQYALLISVVEMFFKF